MSSNWCWGDLFACDEKRRAVFEQFSVEPYRAPITRYGNRETVVVVACNGNEVVYYEEIEEGFNVSPLGLGWNSSGALVQSG